MKYILILCLVLSGCQHSQPETFVPVRAESRVPSFDGNVADSGIKEFIPNKGFVLSDSAVARYKSLCTKFQADPIGLSTYDGKNILDKEGMVQFLELNDRNLNK